MENLAKEFDKKFSHKKIVGMKLLENGIGSYKFVDFRSEVKSFIRQREKELLEELEVKLIAEEAKGSLGVPAPRVLDTFMRKELSNE